MKLIIENWNKFLNEEEIEEGLLKKLAVAAALIGGAGQSAEAGLGDFFKNKAGAESHQTQQAPQEGLSEDGKSFTAKFKLNPNDIQAALQGADMSARAGLAQSLGTNTISASVTSRTQVGDYLYSTVTLNQ